MAARAFRGLHGLIAVVFLLAIVYVWWCALTGRRERWLRAAVAALVIEGVLVTANREDCPLGGLQDRLGDPLPLFRARALTFRGSPRRASPWSRHGRGHRLAHTPRPVSDVTGASVIRRAAALLPRGRRDTGPRPRPAAPRRAWQKRAKTRRAVSRLRLPRTRGRAAVWRCELRAPYASAASRCSPSRRASSSGRSSCTR
jgi:hypothetical protein